MGKVSCEGECIAVAGYEEDYLEFQKPLGGFGKLIGITELVEKASGVESPEWKVLTAFEYMNDPSWERPQELYLKESGRKCPPVYRVKVVIEAEALSEAESLAWWEKLRRERG